MKKRKKLGLLWRKREQVVHLRPKMMTMILVTIVIMMVHPPQVVGVGVEDEVAAVAEGPEAAEDPEVDVEVGVVKEKHP